VSTETAAAISEEYDAARLDGLRTALAVLALMAVVALLFSGRIPTEQPGSSTRKSEVSAAAT
jgi:hypothetical protein